jgi:hypothetical protein
MDLGKTALGNWKAQQGGCTHIQVRLRVLTFDYPFLCIISTPVRIAVFQRNQRPQVSDTLFPGWIDRETKR